MIAKPHLTLATFNFIIFLSCLFFTATQASSRSPKLSIQLNLISITFLNKIHKLCLHRKLCYYFILARSLDSKSVRVVT
jgi:hypothetical protein